jgi:glycosyltransferase involved in cell wall biosynthesis
LSYIHYRQSLFEKLLAVDSPIDFRLICGNTSPYGVRSIGVDPPYLAKNIMVGPFIWQQGMLRKTFELKPEVVVLLGVNPLILSSMVFFLILKLKGIKVVWWGHGTLGNQGVIGRRARLFFYKMADATFVYNEKGKETLLKNGVSASQVFSIGNCINDGDYGLVRIKNLNRRKSGFKQVEKVKLLFSGRLTKVKNVGLIFDCLSQMTEPQKKCFEVIIVGDGPERERLEQEVIRLSLSQYVQFKGEKYDDEIEEFFLQAHFFIHPGSIGLAVFHSLSYGLPVITHNNFETQKPEATVLNYRDNDLLFIEGNSCSLKEKLLSLKHISENTYSQKMNDSIELAKKNMPYSVFEKFVEGINSVLR